MGSPTQPIPVPFASHCPVLASTGRSEIKVVLQCFYWPLQPLMRAKRGLVWLEETGMPSSPNFGITIIYIQIFRTKSIFLFCAVKEIVG